MKTAAVLFMVRTVRVLTMEGAAVPTGGGGGCGGSVAVIVIN